MKRAALVVLAACGRIDFVPEGDSSAALGFCASQTPTPTLCADFDNGIGTVWNNQQTNGGAYALDTAAGASPPASLAVSLDALATSSTTARVDIEADRVANGSHVNASAAMRVDDAGMVEIVMLEFDIDDGTTDHGIELVYRPSPGLAYIEDTLGPSGGNSTSFAYYQLVSVPPGDWHTWSLDLTSTLLVVTLDGAQVLSMAPAASIAGNTSMQIGAVYLTGPSMPAQLHFDNVVLYVD
jgi:hypothetical protein